jgi:ABC-type sugar transport system ATPase subunit
VLVGPSGCCKSTLLNTIAGLETITSGEIRIAGRKVSDLHPSQRDFAMVFLSYALYPNMTVAGNIGFGMEMRGVSPLPGKEQSPADRHNDLVPAPAPEDCSWTCLASRHRSCKRPSAAVLCMKH